MRGRPRRRRRLNRGTAPRSEPLGAQCGDASPASHATPFASFCPETYAATRLPVDLATTLIPDAYTSADFYELEQQRVYGGAWVGVATTSELAEPGDYVVVESQGAR